MVTRDKAFVYYIYGSLLNWILETAKQGTNIDRRTQKGKNLLRNKKIIRWRVFQWLQGYHHRHREFVH